jgi:hypothetical protein
MMATDVLDKLKIINTGHPPAQALRPFFYDEPRICSRGTGRTLLLEMIYRLLLPVRPAISRLLKSVYRPTSVRHRHSIADAGDRAHNGER